MSNTENFPVRSADKVLTANDLFLSSACVTERTAMVREFDIHKLWAVVHLGRSVQESVSRAARSRLNRLIKEQRRIKIDLEDKGQDLLSMTLDKHGVVIDCNAQAWCWVGGWATACFTSPATTSATRWRFLRCGRAASRSMAGCWG